MASHFNASLKVKTLPMCVLGALPLHLLIRNHCGLSRYLAGNDNFATVKLPLHLELSVLYFWLHFPFALVQCHLWEHYSASSSYYHSVIFPTCLEVACLHALGS